MGFARRANYESPRTRSAQREKMPFSTAGDQWSPLRPLRKFVLASYLRRAIRESPLRAVREVVLRTVPTVFADISQAALCTADISNKIKTRREPMAVRRVFTLKKPHLAFSKKLGQRHLVNKTPFPKRSFGSFLLKKRTKKRKKENKTISNSQICILYGANCQNRRRET